MPVKKNINLTTFVTDYAEIMAAAAAEHIVNTAVRLVRVDQGTLKNSIRKVKTTTGYVVETGSLAYAAAQEYGLASFGKPNYRFTPYMRPAAVELKNASILKTIAERAMKAAILKNRV